MRKHLLKSFFAGIAHASFEVGYWDGETARYGDGQPRVKVIFNKPLPLTFNLEPGKRLFLAVAGRNNELLLRLF